MLNLLLSPVCEVPVATIPTEEYWWVESCSSYRQVGDLKEECHSFPMAGGPMEV